MNEWSVAALALLAGLVPCGVVCLRGSPVDRLVGLELAGVLDTLVLLLLAEGFHRQVYFDLALATWSDEPDLILTNGRITTLGEGIVPPNNQGITALLMLNILEGFDLASLAPFGAERLHLEIEAGRLAYRQAS